MMPPSSAPAVGRRPKLEELRHRGYGGGVIAQHRAMFTSPHHATKILGAVVLTLVTFYIWLFALNWVTRSWALVLDFWREVLGMGGYVEMWRYPFGLEVPYLHSGGGLPSFGQWSIGALLTIALFIVSFLMPKKSLPIAYFIRVTAFFQTCSQIFFLFWPRLFPYTASGYIHGTLIATVFLISLVPILLGLTYHVFDFSLGKKIGLTLIIMVYLCILVPFQYMSHAFIMYHASVLYMPVLFFVFGLPFNVMMFITLYAWGMSWDDELRREQFRARRLRTAGPQVSHEQTS
jgi:hypothetical protein